MRDSADFRDAHIHMNRDVLQKKHWKDSLHKILLSIREILQFFPKWKKVVDVRKKYVIIICSAIKIPEQSSDAQYRTGGEVRCETMSNVIVKENETLDSALRRFKRNCAKAGIQQEIRKREHYEKPSVRRKKKSEAARKRKYN